MAGSFLMGGVMTPREVTLKYFEKSKVFLKRSRISILAGGVMAGMLIAMAGLVSYAATMDSANFVGMGITKILRGIIFSFGLLTIVISGGDLFTGTLLYTPGTSGAEKIELLKRMGLVIFGNFLGSIFLLLLAQASGALTSPLVEVIEPIAQGKMALSPLAALVSGFLCNFLVTLSLRAMEASPDFGGKALANILVITVFIIGGFEHSVANLFTIPAGMGLGVLGQVNFYTTLALVIIGNGLGGAFLGYLANYIYKDL